MQVTFTDTLAGVDFVYRAGQTYDLDDEKAIKWIAAGLCRKAPEPTDPPVKQPGKIETGTIKPPIETADRKPTATKKRGK